MAEMIPDSIPIDAKPGEKVLFSIFRDLLPDNFIVWHEPSATAKRPDFVVLSDTHGLLIVEAKGYSTSMIKQADGNHIVVKRPGKDGNPAREETEKHPLKQAESYKNDLEDKLKVEPILCNPQPGPHFGKLIFPRGRAAIMTSITRSEIEREDLARPGLAAVFIQDSLLFADDVRGWKEMNDREVIARFWDLFDSRAKFSFPPLTGDQIQTIRAVLNPSTIVKRVSATPKSWNLIAPAPRDATVIQTLDLQQERAAKQLGNGHRILSGVAGSGKTLILTSRARWLLESEKDQRILITCFNITLAAYIRSIINDAEVLKEKLCEPGIETRHFHGWAGAICGRSLPSYPKGGSDEQNDMVDEATAHRVMEQLERRPELRYDAILVDEAHIMHPSWLKALRTALKDPENGSMLIVNDVSQKLEKRRKFTWSSVGINARGRVRIYKKNYRNTKQILYSAWSLLSTLSNAEPEADETFPLVVPDQSEREGPRPRLMIAKAGTDLGRLALEACKQEIASGQDAKNIAFIYRFSFYPRLQNFLDQANSALLNESFYWVTESRTTKASYGANAPGVRLLTTKSALGLEFKSVYLLWLEDFEKNWRPSDPESQLRILRELYVAMTRAQDQLTLLCSSTSRLGAQLARDHENLGLEVIHE